MIKLVPYGLQLRITITLSTNTDNCTHIPLITNLLTLYTYLHHVSTHKGSSSGNKSDIFQQGGSKNESPFVKFPVL